MPKATSTMAALVCCPLWAALCADTAEAGRARGVRLGLEALDADMATGLKIKRTIVLFCTEFP
jgi:hypothetical protein